MKKIPIVFVVIFGCISLAAKAQNRIEHVDITLIHEIEATQDSNGWAAYAILESFDKALSSAGLQVHTHLYSQKNAKKDAFSPEALIKMDGSPFQYAVWISSRMDKDRVEYTVDAVAVEQKKYLSKKQVYKTDIPGLFSAHQKAVVDFMKALGTLNKEAIEKAAGKIQTTSSAIAYRYYVNGKLLQTLTATDERLSQAVIWYQQAIDADEAFYPAHAALAQVHVQKKEYERAFTIYQGFLAKSPSARGANLAVGDIYFYHLNDAKKAKSYYEKELTLDPKSSAALVRLGYCAYDDKNYELSRQYASQALKLSAMDTPALNLLGLSAMGLKDSLKAKEYFQQAASINRYEVPARKNLARLLELKNKFDEAKKLYLEIVQTDPLDAFAYLSFANLCYLQGAMKEAAAYYMQGVLIRPELESPKENPIQIFQFLSKNRKDTERVEALADSMSEAVMEGDLSAPEEFSYRCAIGYASLYYLNDFAEAANQFQTALKLRPDAARLRFYLAESYFRSDKPAQALDYYRIYADDAKDSYNFARCHLMIGKILVKQRKFEDAQLEILKSIRIYPNAESYYYYGLALRGNKQNEEAVTAFEKAIKTFPQYVEAHMELSRTYEDLKKMDKALQSAQKASSIDSLHVYARQALAHVYFVLERWEDAEKEITEGIRLMNAAGRNDPVLYGDYGDILLMQNKPDLALSHYERQWDLDSASAQSPYRIASIYGARGDEKNASLWMLKAFRNNFTDFTDLDKNKMFNPVRKKPVFMELVKQYEQAYREELLKRIQQKKQ